MISLILPIHNEAAILRDAVSQVEQTMKKLGKYEIIIFEDGSTDPSAEIAKSLQSATVRTIISKERLGRGLSLDKAIAEAKGETIIYLDADLATDLKHIPQLIKENADICTGSRLLPDSIVEGRSMTREIASKGYNLLLRILFNSKIKDHQCGFKAFRRSTVLPLLKSVKDKHWFWDSELLILAQRNGLVVKEIPVHWKDRQESRVRLGSDIIHMGISALRLRCRLWK